MSQRNGGKWNFILTLISVITRKAQSLLLSFSFLAVLAVKTKCLCTCALGKPSPSTPPSPAVCQTAELVCGFLLLITSHGLGHFPSPSRPPFSSWLMGVSWIFSRRIIGLERILKHFHLWLVYFIVLDLTRRSFLKVFLEFYFLLKLYHFPFPFLHSTLP